MSDPAIEAAQRVLEDMGFHSPSDVDLIAAAREMAKPIRELHRKYWFTYKGHAWCSHDEQEWPCDTAYLVYPTEELEKMK